MTQAANLAGTGVCKAWVQFAGGVSPSINGSFNVASITRNSTGNYTVTFTTPLTDINYAVAGGANTNLAANGWLTAYPFTDNTAPYYIAPTTSNFRVIFSYSGGSGGQAEPVRASIIVFGN